MPAPNLGPQHDLSKRIADLEAKVRSLSSPGILPPTGWPAMIDPNQNVATVTVSAANFTGTHMAYFPYTHEYAAYAIWASVPAGTLATFQLVSGPISAQGLLARNTISWTLDGTSGAIGYPHYGGYPFTLQSNPAFDLGGTPADYGTAWGISLQAKVNSGSVTVWAPCFVGRATQ